MRVRLMERPLKKKKGEVEGRTTLFLRYWDADNKKYVHEFLKFKLSNDPKRKAEDKNLWAQAEMIRIAKESELTSAQLGTAPLIKKKQPFIEYFESVMKNNNWKAVLSHLKRFPRKSVSVSLVNEDWLKDLRDFLLAQRKVSQNSANRYYSIIKACLNKALKSRLIAYNPSVMIDGIKQVQKKVESLTEKEIEQLDKTPLKNEETKRAFLFSCFSGLRYSDVKKLTFGDLDFSKKEIVIVQKKTGDLVKVPLLQQAKDLALKNIPAGTTPLSSMLVFPALGTPQVVNKDLKNWQPLIKKRIHFHLARATFASNCYEKTEDVYAVSRLLGHKNISATQKYLKVSGRKLADVVFQGLGHIKITTK